MSGIDERLAAHRDIAKAIIDSSRTCTGCNRVEIFFATTRNNKTIPIELEPVEGGRFTIRKVPYQKGDRGHKFQARYIDAHDFELHRQNQGAPPLAFRSHIDQCQKGAAS